MIRLEEQNNNTPEYYNKSSVTHFVEKGLIDDKDQWRIKWLIKDFKGGRLLDLGCGVSSLQLIAAQVKDSEVHALDFADLYISIISNIVENMSLHSVKFVSSRVEKTPYEDKYFDYIVMGELLEHCEDPYEVIKEAKRILKDDGLIAISTPNNETIEKHKEKNHIWGINEEDIRKMVDVKQLDIVGDCILCIGRK